MSELRKIIDQLNMTHKDIQNHKDLQIFIAYEIRKQITIKKQTVEIKLDKVWFFKLAKLIQFILKNNEEEKDAKIIIPESCTWYKVKINNVTTTFRKYDI